MSTNKIMALIGNILLTLSNVIVLFCAVIGLAVISAIPDRYDDGAMNDFFSSSYSYSDYRAQMFLNNYLSLIVVILAVILVIAIVMNVFTWIAFAKMEGPHGRGWKIFLLVMGVLNISSFFAGVFFILAFALNSTKKPIENTTIN